jgi:nucleotide-binding universal stress UspA family protein
MANGRPTVVVGVDGSERSIEALQWAARQALLTGSAIRVITAWTYPDEPTPFGLVPEVPLPPDQLEAARAELDAAVTSNIPSTGLDIVTEVIAGHAAPVLIDASRSSDLLVVGNSGRGLIAEMLLGSVTERCVRHAECPVVVIRGRFRLP